MDGPRLQTIVRRTDEPKLALGDTVIVKQGVVGVVVARFVPTAKPGEVHYILQMKAQTTRQSHLAWHASL